MSERPPESVFLRERSRFDDLDIDLRLGAPATRLDLDEETVDVAGKPLGFDGLIVATGASPRTLPRLDSFGNVYVLRTLEDARVLREAFDRGPKVLVIGGGVIGVEVAASARTRGLEVTIVEVASAPMVRSVGESMGRVCASLHRRHGTVVLCRTELAGVEGGTDAQRLLLSDGSTLEPDIVVVGVGVAPNTAWLKRSGLTIENGVVCDATLNAGHRDVYAAGDVANWPNALLGQRMRCEQWTNAVEQGRHAARNLLSGRSGAQPFMGSNYFWSDQYAARLQFVGCPVADEVVVVDGKIADEKFLAWYRRGDRLVGAFGMNSVRLLMKSKALIEQGVLWEDAAAQLGDKREM